jgi:hypothetical protein
VQKLYPNKWVEKVATPHSSASQIEVIDLCEDSLASGRQEMQCPHIERHVDEVNQKF